LLTLAPPRATTPLPYVSPPRSGAARRPGRGRHRL
jgi:hypothetical protein